MGDVVSGAAREFWDMLVRAVTDPGPWTFVGVGAAVVIAVAILLRGKLASPWVMIPVLGAVAYWGWREFVR